jgi:hypothetical protein
LLTAQTSFLQRYRKPLLLLTAAWTAMGVVIYVWVPLLVPALLLLSPVAPVAWYAATRLRPPPHKPSAITIALILAGAYLTLNASWSLSPAMAHITLAFFFLFVLALYFTCNTCAGRSVDFETSESCPAQVVLSGRKQPGDCVVEHVVTKAMCQ